jgi:quinol monooxygenase YgiN
MMSAFIKILSDPLPGRAAWDARRILSAVRIKFGREVMTAIKQAAIAAAGLVALAATPAPAFAQVAQPAFAVTYIDVTPSGAANAADLLRNAAAASRKEAGNLRYEVLVQIDRTNRLAILEAWGDSKAFEAHTASAAMTRFRGALKPVLIGFYDQRPSIGIALGPTPAAGSPGAVYVLTHVDAAGNAKEQALALLNKLAEDSRKEPGCERFEIWQQGNRANHFTVNEVWKDQAAQAAHLVAAATRDFRDKVGPILGALYDDRLYKAIE